MFGEPELCNMRGQKGLGSVTSLSEPERASRIISSLSWVSEQETQRWFPRLQAHPGSLAQHMTPWAAAAAELCGVARSLGSECHLTIPAGTCFESCRDRKLSNRKLGSGYNDNSAVLLMTLEQRNAHCKPAPSPPPCKEHKTMCVRHTFCCLSVLRRAPWDMEGNPSLPLDIRISFFKAPRSLNAHCSSGIWELPSSHWILRSHRALAF